MQVIVWLRREQKALLHCVQRLAAVAVAYDRGALGKVLFIVVQWNGCQAVQCEALLPELSCVV